MAVQSITNLKAELRGLISEISEVEENKISDEAKFVEDLGIDSMMALEIVAKVEKKYKVKIPEEKIPTIVSLNNVAQLLEQLL